MYIIGYIKRFKYGKILHINYEGVALSKIRGYANSFQIQSIRANNPNMRANFINQGFYHYLSCIYV